MLKWTIRIVGVILALIAVVYVIGMTLPVKHTATITGTVNATPEQVWNRLTDVSKYPEWRKNLKSVTIVSETEWIENLENDNLPLKVKEATPPTRLVGMINDAGLPFGGEWVYQIAPSGNQSVVTITENGEVYNPIFRFVSKYIMGHDTSLKEYMKYLQDSFK